MDPVFLQKILETVIETVVCALKPKRHCDDRDQANEIIIGGQLLHTVNQGQERVLYWGGKEISRSTNLIFPALSGGMGGYGVVKVADSVTQELIASKKSEIEQIIGKCKTLEAKEFQTQIVAGTNYLIKVLKDNKSFIIVKIYTSLSGESKVMGANIVPVDPETGLHPHP